MLKILRNLKHFIAFEIEKRNLKGIYSKVHSNLESETHIVEAASWLRRAQDHGSDRGVSYGMVFGQDFLASYPETTGYIIQTFLRLAREYNDPEYQKRAVEMGNWEISIQMASGAVMGGRVDSVPPTPAVFNTGMVLLGWAELFKETGEKHFCEAGFRAGNWLSQIQDNDGAWRKGNSTFADPESTVYNVKAAWGLCLMGKVSNNDQFVQAAMRNVEFAISRQTNTGWFRDCCLTDVGKPLLHTLAYTMQGILEIGILIDRTDLIEAVRKTADGLMTVMQEDGFLAGRFYPDFKSAVSWSCLTGSAQTSVVWSRLFQITGDVRYREAVGRVNKYLMSRHDIFSKAPTIRGGVTGSWPVWGEYGPFRIFNWATKFLIDALLMEKEIEKL